MYIYIFTISFLFSLSTTFYRPDIRLSYAFSAVASSCQPNSVYGTDNWSGRELRGRGSVLCSTDSSMHHSGDSCWVAAQGL